jgi:hypothetical protein
MCSANTNDADTGDEDVDENNIVQQDDNNVTKVMKVSSNKTRHPCPTEKLTVLLLLLFDEDRQRRYRRRSSPCRRDGHAGLTLEDIVIVYVDWFCGEVLSFRFV